jgi:hypothetical protein
MKWLKAVTSRSTRLELPCRVFVDLCEGKLWLPDSTARLTPLGDAHPHILAEILRSIATYPAASERTELLSFRDAAVRAGIAHKTLYEWKRKGKLRHEHGLRMLGRSPRIEWNLFKAALDSGGLS